MKIKHASVNVCSPGRNFVTLKIETDEGIYGLGDATLNGRELAVASYLSEHVIPCLVGPRSVPDRGHLAVSLSRRVLAARPGDHGGHRRGGHGAVGYQGQGAQHARLQPAGRPQPRRRAGLCARARRRHRRGARRCGAPRQEMGYKRDPRAERHSRPRRDYGVPKGAAAL